jgi:hypothetical protein
MSAAERLAVVNPVSAKRSWRDYAVCRGMDPNLFFPPPGDALRIAQVRTICFTCPVRQQCLDEAVTTGERHGVRGGEFLEDFRRPRPRIIMCTRCESTDLIRWNGKIECGDCGFFWDG